MSFRRAIAGFVILLSMTRVLHAEPSAEDKALSAELFKEARKLLSDGKTAEACAKFEESQRLVPADGTLLNLAVCYEALGKTATAYALFTEARARAQRDGRADRVELAEKHLGGLEPRLSRLSIVVPAAADLPELHVFRDGSEVGRAAWGTGMPVDPGEHRIEARAAGKKPWVKSVRVSSDAGLQTIELEPLEPESAQATPPVTPPVVVQPPPKAPARMLETKREPVGEEKGTGGQRTLAYVLGGVGVVGIGVGSYFGLRAFSKWSASNDACPSDRCSAEGAQSAKDARTAADVSTVSFALGGVSLALGTWLLLSDKPHETRASGLTLGAGFDRRSARASLAGRF